MQIITNVTDIKIITWSVNVERQCVIVDFQMMKDNNEPYERMMAVFWVTIPDPSIPDPIGNPSLWYQLPAGYVATLTQLTVDAKTALMPLVA